MRGQKSKKRSSKRDRLELLTAEKSLLTVKNWKSISSLNDQEQKMLVNIKIWQKKQRPNQNCIQKLCKIQKVVILQSRTSRRILFDNCAFSRAVIFALPYLWVQDYQNWEIFQEQHLLCWAPSSIFDECSIKFSTGIERHLANLKPSTVPYLLFRASYIYIFGKRFSPISLPKTRYLWTIIDQFHNIFPFTTSSLLFEAQAHV